MNEAPKKPSPSERVIAELAAQRNGAMDRAAELGAELTATRDALAEAKAENADLAEKLRLKELSAEAPPIIEN